MTLAIHGRHRTGRHSSTGTDPRVLLTTCETEPQAELLRGLYCVITELGLTSDHGVFILQANGGGSTVNLGRHNGEEIRPTPRVLAAAERIGYRQ